VEFYSAVLWERQQTTCRLGAQAKSLCSGAPN
jgi:hypothetical protein